MPDWLDQRVLRSPDRPALIWDGRRWTFDELRAAVRAFTAHLDVAGVRPGDRVAVLAGSGPALVQCVHAVPRLGAVFVPLNLRLMPPELGYQIDAVAARFLIADDAHSALGNELARGRDGLRLLPLSALAASDPLPDDAHPLDARHIDESAVHSIVFTSGTTGRPKGAMLTFGNHLWSALGSALSLGLHDDDRWLACMPLYHVGGLAILLRSVICGIPVVLHASFDPAAANRAIDNDGVTIVSVVARMLAAMLEERGDRPYPPTFRLALLGGGPAPAPLLADCAARGIPVAPTYGLTETASQVATVPPPLASESPSARRAARPLWNTEIRIVRDGVDLPPGEAGEILVRGPTVMAGYDADPEATARTVVDGWLHTGDVGSLDEYGGLRVLDRRADLIISGGENVYPAEVEAVLLTHPDVVDAGVVAVADARWGQRPVAAVCLRLGASADTDALSRFCAERLAAYKRPDAIRVLAALPRNAAGKLRRDVLRALLSRSTPDAKENRQNENR